MLATDAITRQQLTSIPAGETWMHPQEFRTMMHVALGGQAPVFHGKEGNDICAEACRAAGGNQHRRQKAKRSETPNPADPEEPTEEAHRKLRKLGKMPICRTFPS